MELEKEAGDLTSNLGHLDSFKVTNAPDVAYYIPDFITEEEGKYLLSQVYAAPKPKWTQLSHRRLQNWGGLPHPKGMIAEGLPKWLDVYAKKIAGLRVFDEHIPNHVLVNEYQPGQGIMPHEDGPLFYPVVTTINLGSHTFLDFYKRREEGSGEGPPCSNITDGSNDSVSSTSKDLQTQDGSAPGSSEVLQTPFLSLLLEPLSLLVLRDSMYTSHLHGIADRTTDTVTEAVANMASTERSVGDLLERTCRVSLTVRYVPKTLKMRLLFGKR